MIRIYNIYSRITNGLSNGYPVVIIFFYREKSGKGGILRGAVHMKDFQMVVFASQMSNSTGVDHISSHDFSTAALRVLFIGWVSEA